MLAYDFAKNNIIAIGAAKMRFCPFFAGRCGVSPLEGVAAGEAGAQGKAFPSFSLIQHRFFRIRRLLVKRNENF